MYKRQVVVITNEEAEGLISEEYNGTREGDQLHEVIAQSSKRINVALVGNPNSGKTTLLEKLLPALRSRGLKVGIIKHDGHDFTPDVPGTDSYRLL